MSNSNYVFFPSCKVTAQFPAASEKLKAYLKEKYGVDPVGCCRENHQKLTADDTALVVCNTCAAIVEENSNAKLKYVWKLIDEDDEFNFPDYHGESMTVQDCYVAFDRRKVQDAVRSLMQKMNIKIVEQSENYDKTRFCGPTLLAPCKEDNARLAHKRFVEKYPEMFTPMDAAQQKNHFMQHCSGISTEKVVCYCRPCAEGIKAGGKTAMHIMELLFGTV